MGGKALRSLREEVGAAVAFIRTTRVLCLASDETTETVRAVARRKGLSVAAAQTAADALRLATRGGPWALVVTAPGAADGVDAIFDRAGDRSSLIDAARASGGSCPVVVFSGEACRTLEYKRACEDAGANGVVCTSEQLVCFIEDWAMRSRAGKVASTLQAEEGHRMDGEYQKPEEYGPLARRIQRDRELEARLGTRHRAMRRSREFTRRLAAMVGALEQPLIGKRGVGKYWVRFVHVSDTHTLHDLVYLPVGDVLLYTGNITGNYGGGRDPDPPLLQHFTGFLDWLRRASCLFKHVLFIAGSHDTVLDPAASTRSKEAVGAGDARALLKQVLAETPNLQYLENSGTTVMRGVRVWGSPVTCSRHEILGRQHCSSAFEATRAERVKAWARIPDGKVDVLMTHGPPRCPLMQPDWGDEALTARLSSMRYPPSFHCFGHDHDSFGVAPSVDRRTVLLNGAQERLLQRDRKGGGCAWVFDVMVP